MSGRVCFERSFRRLERVPLSIKLATPNVNHQSRDIGQGFDKGAEAVAGSNPSHLRTKGSMQLLGLALHERIKRDLNGHDAAAPRAKSPVH